MGFINKIHGGAAPSDTTSVYYTGTSTLGEGYVLCYDFNAYDVNQENTAQTSPNVGEEVWADARRVLVEKCTEQNKLHFAGVVARDSDGVTGPGWVTIHRPGSICNVYCYSDIDSENPAAGTEGAGTACGELINIVVGQWYMRKFGFPGCGAALVLQDVDCSSAAGLVMAELMTGLPSGGINYLDAMTSIENGVANTLGCTASNLMGYVPACCGCYVATDGGISDMILSFVIEDADAGFIGQRVGIFNSTFISDSISLQISLCNRSVLTDIDGGAGGLIVTSASFEISAAGDYITLEWDGVNWRFLTGHEVVLSV